MKVNLNFWSGYTITVTIPDSLTVTPNNRNKYLSDVWTPSVTINKSIPAEYSGIAAFAIYAEAANGYRIHLGTWYIRNVNGKTTVTALTIDTADKKRERLGAIAERTLDWKNNGQTDHRITKLHIALSNWTDISAGIYDRKSFSFPVTCSGFTPAASTLTATKTTSSTINSQFGLVKGFCSGTFTGNISTAGLQWSWSAASGGDFTGVIKPKTTVKVSAGGQTASTTNYGTGFSASVTINPINSTSVSQTVSLTNVLGGSLTKSGGSTAIQDYYTPKLSSVTAKRGSGTSVNLSAKWDVAPVNKTSTVGSVTTGTVKIDWTGKANTSGATTWSGTQTIAANGSTMSATTDTLSFTDSAHAYESEKSYTFTFKLTDRLGKSTTVTVVMPTRFLTIDFKAGGGGVAFGRVADENNKVLFDRRMIPKVINGTPDTSTFYQAERTDKGIIVDFGIGASGEAYGIWSEYNSNWIINEDINGVTRIPNTDIRLAGHSSSIGTVVNGWLSSAKSVPTGKSSGTMLCSVSLDAGVWLVTAGARFPANSTGVRVMNVATSSGATAWDMSVAAQSAETLQMRGAWVFMPSSTTPYYLNVMQTSGSSLSMPASGSGYGSFIRAVRIL